MKPSNTVFLFTGKIYPDCFDNFIESTKNIQEIKIASIWDTENSVYVQELIDNNFRIVSNNSKEQDKYVPQFVPIVNGLQYIKENFNTVEYVLRTRFDILSYNYSKYLEKTRELYKEKITVISGIESSSFLQIVECGKVDAMCKFYTLQLNSDKRPPEQFILDNYLNITNYNRENIRQKINFSLNICIQYNIEFIWFRPQHWKTPLRTIPNMRVINEYCKDTFIWS